MAAEMTNATSASPRTRRRRRTVNEAIRPNMTRTPTCVNDVYITGPTQPAPKRCVQMTGVTSFPQGSLVAAALSRLPRERTAPAPVAGPLPPGGPIAGTARDRACAYDRTAPRSAAPAGLQNTRSAGALPSLAGSRPRERHRGTSDPCGKGGRALRERRPSSAGTTSRLGLRGRRTRRRRCTSTGSCRPRPASWTGSS